MAWAKSCNMPKATVLTVPTGKLYNRYRKHLLVIMYKSAHSRRVLFPNRKRRGHIMNSAEKTVTLLKILARKPYVYGVTELGEKIGCGKSGTFKLLNVLVQEGLAAQTPEHKYTLGMVSYLLGKCYEDHVGVVRFVRPYLERLRDLTGETATFGMLVNGVPTSICREEGTHMVRVMGHLGGTRPLNAGAIGKMLGAYMGEADLRRHLLETPAHAYTERTLTDPEAILEELKKVREQGYAISDGDFNLDTISFGAPVTDTSGAVWAAVALSAPRTRVDAATRDRYLFQVREIAAQISRELGQTLVVD